MASPYRESVIMMADDPPAIFSCAPFGGEKPKCPVCTQYAYAPGKICNGRKTFWCRKHICPTRPHFHPKCHACDHTWLMATRSDREAPP